MIQIQLALIGIVVVIGLFYLWRIITRLEERVEKNIAKSQISSHKNSEIPKLFPSKTENASPFMMSQYQCENSQEEMANAEELMKHVFGGISMENPGMSIFTMGIPPDFHQQSHNYQQSTVVVEELNEPENNDEMKDTGLEQTNITNKKVKAHAKEHTNEDNDEDSETNDDTLSLDTNPMSKSKLMQMKVEKLRTLCKARELSTDGVKPELIERLLGLQRE